KAEIMRRALFGTVGALVAALGLAGIATPADALIVRLHRPSAPTNVVATGVNTAIVASWAAPLSDGGSPITGYIAKVGLKPCMPTGPMSCIVTGLKNTRSYTFVVRAVNALGNGRVFRVLYVHPTTTQNCSYVGPLANLQGCSLQ